MADFVNSSGVATLHSSKPDPANGQKENNAHHTDLGDAFGDLTIGAFTSSTATSADENPLQVVFSFDTTASMYHVLDEVRARLSEMLQRLYTDLPGITIAVVAHGDYYFYNPYVTKHIDFTNDMQKLVEFVNGVEKTFGCDLPEAYELMLRVVRKDLSWSPGSRRILVVIGDSRPHPFGDYRNENNIDWEEEARMLKEQLGVRIYGIQVDNDYESTNFFQKLTKMTEGQHLRLSRTTEPVRDAAVAICFREKGPEYLREFEAEVRERKGSDGLHVDLDNIFKALSHHAASFPIVASISTIKCQAQTKTKKKKLRKRIRSASNLKIPWEIYMERLPRRNSTCTRKDLRPKSPWPECPARTPRGSPWSQPATARTPRESSRYTPAPLASNAPAHARSKTPATSLRSAGTKH